MLVIYKESYSTPHIFSLIIGHIPVPNIKRNRSKNIIEIFTFVDACCPLKKCRTRIYSSCCDSELDTSSINSCLAAEVLNSPCQTSSTFTSFVILPVL